MAATFKGLWRACVRTLPYILKTLFLVYFCKLFARGWRLLMRGYDDTNAFFARTSYKLGNAASAVGTGAPPDDTITMAQRECLQWARRHKGGLFSGLRSCSVGCFFMICACLLSVPTIYIAIKLYRMSHPAPATQTTPDNEKASAEAPAATDASGPSPESTDGEAVSRESSDKPSAQADTGNIETR